MSNNNTKNVNINCESSVEFCFQIFHSFILLIYIFNLTISNL